MKALIADDGKENRLDFQHLAEKLTLELIQELEEDSLLGKSIEISSKAQNLMEDSDPELKSFAAVLNEFAKRFDHEQIETLLNQIRTAKNG